MLGRLGVGGIDLENTKFNVPRMPVVRQTARSYVSEINNEIFRRYSNDVSWWRCPIIKWRGPESRESVEK